MNKYVSRGLWFALFVGGLTLGGAAAANAATTSGADGAVSGTQVAPSVDAPVSVAGNALGLLGDAVSSVVPTPAAPAAPAAAAPAAPAAPTAAPTTSGSDGVGSGTQVVPDVSAPVSVGGNAIAVGGDAVSSAPAAAPAAPAAAPAAPAAAPAAPATSGSDGIASGAQVAGAVTAPVDVSENAVSLAGDAVATHTAPAAAAPASPAPAAPAAPVAGAPTTSGSDGIGSGTQVVPAIEVPITVSGNGIGLVGDGSSTGSSAAAVPAGSSTGSATTDGADGVASGTQVSPVVSV
ncbi:hypothetical protein ACIPNL_06780, partial [Curtobacterium sp. NPDC090221]